MSLKAYAGTSIKGLSRKGGFEIETEKILREKPLTLRIVEGATKGYVLTLDPISFFETDPSILQGTLEDIKQAINDIQAAIKKEKGGI